MGSKHGIPSSASASSSSTAAAHRSGSIWLLGHGVTMLLFYHPAPHTSTGSTIRAVHPNRAKDFATRPVLVPGELARSDRSITRPGHSRATGFGSHFSFPFVVERNIDISIMPLPALCSPSLCLVVLPCTPCYAPTTIAGLISAGPTTSEVHKFFKRDLLRNLPAWAEHTLAQQRQ